MTSTLNRWIDRKCAKAFWSQCDLPPYQRLLEDTLAWTEPKPGERWLDLGCGGGSLTRGLWMASGGTVEKIVAADVAPANQKAIHQLRSELGPEAESRIEFVTHDFSQGLSLFADREFNAVISGLSISYAESRDADSGEWTMKAYDRLLSELHRVLTPGGRLIFSVNVPDPSWSRIAWKSVGSIWRNGRPLKYAKNSWRMLQYGRWLKQEALRGRFHFLSAETVRMKLEAAGFERVEHRLSYENQAFIFRAHKTEGART